jgi:hypothetical protein
MPAVCNPFGIDLAPGGLADDAYWTLIAETLAVPYYRPGTVFLDTGGVCDRCTAAIQHDRKLVLVVRAGGTATTPTAPPADLGTYRSRLGAVLDESDAAVAAVVIEDEVDARYSGTAEEYLAELAAGCEVAHQRGVRCADGGMSSASLVLLLASYYEGLGNPGAALHLVSVAGGNPDVVSAFATWPPTTEQALTDGLATRKAAIDRLRVILAGEREAGVDYANFHWYERDTDTLDVAIAFMRNVTRCNAVMTSAIGQRGQDPLEALHKLDDAKELGLGLVIWDSGNAADAASVVDALGSLTPSGETLQTLSMESVCGT